MTDLAKQCMEAIVAFDDALKQNKYYMPQIYTLRGLADQCREALAKPKPDLYAALEPVEKYLEKYGTTESWQP